ncbi:MAG: SudD [Meiothermus sp.]
MPPDFYFPERTVMGMKTEALTVFPHPKPFLYSNEVPMLPEDKNWLETEGASLQKAPRPNVSFQGQESWLEGELNDVELQDDDPQAGEYFADRAHRKARKPPRRQTVKKLLEEGLKNPTAPKFSDPGLQSLWEAEKFTELLWELRSGKEATVYVVQGPQGLLAAKLYVDSRVRSFRNDAMYREGRFVGDKRMRKAMDQSSEFGISMQNVLWVGEEYHQLHALHRAGVSVPKPVAQAGNVILMEFIGDEEGPAPRVSEAGLSREEAESALEQAIYNLGLILSLGKIHGDYSTFNLLWWRGKVVVIDFPQVVEWDKNPHTKEILERDVRGLCRTFSHLGLHPKPEAVLRKVWQIAHANPTVFTPERVVYL